MVDSRQINHGHGRVEVRKLWALPIYDDFITWPGARSMLRQERTFTCKRTGKTTVELDYALCSLSPNELSADEFLAFWRGHWRIESHHYLRDVTLGEDACRVRTGTAPQVLAAIRNLLVVVARRAGFSNLAEALRTFAQNVVPALLQFILLGA